MGILKKTVSDAKDIVLIAVDATDLVEKSMQLSKAYPPALVHVGHAMMGALLIQNLIQKKTPHSIGLQWQANGPFGHLYCDSNFKGQTRATIQNPQAPVHDFQTPLGKGKLQVVIRQKDQTNSFTSFVESTGDICEDLLEFLDKSQQRACGMNLSVKIDWDESNKEFPFQVSHAVGYLIEVLPNDNHQRHVTRVVQWDQYMRNLGPLSSWDFGQDRVDSILGFLAAKPSVHPVAFQNVEFFCNCTQERAERALALADKLENDPSVKKQHEEIRCEYCGKIYILDR